MDFITNFMDGIISEQNGFLAFCFYVGTHFPMIGYLFVAIGLGVVISTIVWVVNLIGG